MYYITYDNETVVYNSDHKQLVKCPTEQEAKEYIHDNSYKTCKSGLVKSASPLNNRTE